METQSVLPTEPVVQTPSPAPIDHIPVMGKESMWSSFQNILTFISLAFFAGSIHSLWSIFVNQWLPPTKNYYYGSVGAYLLNPSIATLLVSTPLFIFLFIMTNKKYSLEPDLKKSKSKTILNYITLVITFIILIVRIISAITTALNDTFSANFGYHLLITSIICGLIFGYYLYETRIEKEPGSIARYIIGGVILSLFAIITFLISLSVRTELKIKQAQVMQPSMDSSPAQIPKKIILSKATNLPSKKQTIQGLDFSVESAQTYELKEGKILELSLMFSATDQCYPTGTINCGVNHYGFQGTDTDGYKLERTLLNSLETIKGESLRTGEKSKGQYFFKLTELSSKYYITYNDTAGKYSEKIEINLK